MIETIVGLNPSNASFVTLRHRTRYSNRKARSAIRRIRRYGISLQTLDNPVRDVRGDIVGFIWVPR